MCLCWNISFLELDLELMESVFKLSIKKYFLLPILFLVAPVPVAGETVYTMGVFPHLPKHKLYETYLPVVKNFQSVLGVKFVLKTRPSFEAYENALKNEEFDIALIQPFDFLDAYDNHGYLPVARRADPLTSILVVKKSSVFNSLADLQGKKIANPAKSAAVTRLTDRLMIKAGFHPQKDFERIYKKNHFSCMQTVLINKADACGTSLRAMYHYEDKQLKDRLKVIAESDAIPHVLYVVHKRVPEQQRMSLKESILDWQYTSEGRSILKTSRMTRFVEASGQEYDILRN